MAAKNKTGEKPRVFNISQQTEYIDENTIVGALAHRTIEKWAYILHDKDRYTEEDEAKGKGIAGALRPAHYHVVLKTKGGLSVETIAKWFNIEPNFIDIPSGWGAFWDCAEYLTHENVKQQILGKHLYSYLEVKANFNFRDEIDRRKKEIEDFGKELSTKERLRLAVLCNGMTLRDARASDVMNYIEDCEKLKKLRLQYLDTAPAPPVRISFYLCGSGGSGKGLISRGIARGMFPELTDDGDIFHTVGAEDVNFEGYDGQPVIIWDDCRAAELLKKLGGRGNVFNVFDPYPQKVRQNVKYGSTNLINRVNIVNSAQPYQEFLDGLAGEYTDRSGNKFFAEDKNQSYRRFPLIIPIREEDFDLLLNKGFLYGNGLFTEYEEYARIQGNMQKIKLALKGHPEEIDRMERQMVSLPVAKGVELLEREEQAVSDEEVQRALKELENYGKPIPVIDVECKAVDEVKDEELPF